MLQRWRKTDPCVVSTQVHACAELPDSQRTVVTSSVLHRDEKLFCRRYLEHSFSFHLCLCQRRLASRSEEEEIREVT